MRGIFGGQKLSGLQRGMFLAKGFENLAHFQDVGDEDGTHICRS